MLNNLKDNKKIAPNMQEISYLTITQAAEKLQVHHHTIRKLIRSGELSAFKIGKQYRIKCAELDNYVKSQKVKFSFVYE